MEQIFAHSRAQERRYLVIMAVVVVLLGSVFPFLMESRYKAPPDFHAVLNLFGSLLGVIAGLALVAHFYSLGERIYLFLGMAFFVSGTMDLLSGILLFSGHHGLVDAPSEELQRYLTATHVGGRMLMGLILILAPSIMGRMGKSRGSQREAVWVSIPILGLSLIATCLLFRLALPDYTGQDQFVPRPVDFLLGLLFTAALAILVLEYHRHRDMLTWWIALSVGVSVVSQFMVAFSQEMYDTFFNIGQAYKAIAYVVPIVGFPICQIQTALERKRALHALREQRSIFRTVLANTPDLIALKDIHFLYQAANSAFCDFLGKIEDDILGKTDYQLFPEHRAEVYRRTDAEVVRSGESQLQDERIAMDGTDRWFHVLKAPVRDGEGNMIAVLSSVRDITELKKLEQRLRVMSHTDELTRLHNRRGFVVAGEQIVKTAKRNKWYGLLVFVDVDKMKTINDTYGHDEGDKVLEDVAKVLRDTFRESDVISRVGGDEFVIFSLQETRESDSSILARLQDAVSAHNAHADRPYEMSLSVGITYYDPEEPRALEVLLTQADKAMYQHKRGKQDPDDPPR